MPVSILVPVAEQCGVDPLHPAMLFIVNLSIVMITPPVGVLLSVTCGIAKVSMEAVLKVIWPDVALETAMLSGIAFLPAITLAVPRWPGSL